MTFATLRAAAQHIARTGTITPHQLAALTALDESLTDSQRQGFTELWRAQGSPAAPAPAGSWLVPAQRIVKEFEGCRLKAYRCPAGVLTIGWGHTGDVQGRPIGRDGALVGCDSVFLRVFGHSRGTLVGNVQEHLAVGPRSV
jgi:hypothetical protein